MKDLREFIDQVQELGELKVVEGANWEWEMGAITYYMAEQPNPPALLFDKVKGYPPGFRVFTIPCSTQKRLALSCEQPVNLDRLELVRALRDKMSQHYKSVPPVVVKKGPVMENIDTGDEVDLFKFPTPQWQPLDGGRYIGTGDTVITKDPDEGWVNVGVYRIQIHDKTTATIFMEPGRHANIIRRKYWARGQSCPVAVTLGGDLLHFNIGTTRIPWGVSEYDYTGWFRGEPMDVIKGPITGLPIPAHAEIVLEGEMVPPEVETRVEGPFSEYTGHYSPARPEPVFRVKSVMYRNDPIILGALPYYAAGVPYVPNYLWRAAHVWEELDRIVPGVKGVWIPTEFGSNRAVVISLEQKYGGHAQQAALAALAVRGYMQRYVIVVDDDVDPTNLNEVLWAMSYRAEPEEFEIIRGFWGGTLDPRLSPEKRAAGDFTLSSAIILAVKPYRWMKDFPVSVKPSLELREKVKRKWDRKLFP